MILDESFFVNHSHSTMSTSTDENELIMNPQQDDVVAIPTRSGDSSFSFKQSSIGEFIQLNSSSRMVVISILR